jgi:hypothetical protein
LIGASLNELLGFLTSLEERRIVYRLEHNRHDSIMVLIAVPGERWEVEFFGDGRIEAEVFGKSTGVHGMDTEQILEKLGN